MEDGDAYSYFHTLDDMPYNFSSYHTKTVTELYRDGWGDCDDKASAFHQYLDNHGYTGSQYVLIYRDGVVTHCFNVYDGLAFDVDEHIYAIPLNDYLTRINQTNQFDSYKIQGE